MRTMEEGRKEARRGSVRREMRVTLESDKRRDCNSECRCSMCSDKLTPPCCCTREEKSFTYIQTLQSTAACPHTGETSKRL